MYCPKCGSNDVLIHTVFSNLKYIICKNCFEEHSIKKHSRIIPEKLDQEQNKYQSCYKEELIKFNKL
ncbi:hypothetical protein [Orenia marismortui]|uniref:hypothetical protein n=1 Tax=Orenia marismortui TaxID=46469 RepID=UPI0003765A34|nr:hypothetical protein [Orenia marismortui]